MNLVKNVMKLLQHDIPYHPVPNHHIVAVKDAQFSWQRFMKTDFCWSLLKSKSLHCSDGRPRWATEWVSHGPSEGIMHRCLERLGKIRCIHVADLHWTNLIFYFIWLSFFMIMFYLCSSIVCYFRNVWTCWRMFGWVLVWSWMLFYIRKTSVQTGADRWRYTVHLFLYKKQRDVRKNMLNSN